MEQAEEEINSLKKELIKRDKTLKDVTERI